MINTPMWFCFGAFALSPPVRAPLQTVCVCKIVCVCLLFEQPLKATCTSSNRVQKGKEIHATTWRFDMLRRSPTLHQHGLTYVHSAASLAPAREQPRKDAQSRRGAACPPFGPCSGCSIQTTFVVTLHRSLMKCLSRKKKATCSSHLHQFVQETVAIFSRRDQCQEYGVHVGCERVSPTSPSSAPQRSRAQVQQQQTSIRLVRPPHTFFSLAIGTRGNGFSGQGTLDSLMRVHSRSPNGFQKRTHRSTND